MPRMSKRRKEEMAVFLNDRNRIQYNRICMGCENDCKQSFRATVMQCPIYRKKVKDNGHKDSKGK